jgi:type III secretion protein S
MRRAMSDSTLLHMTQEGLSLALLLSLPVVVVALVVGLVVGLLQAATRLQEQTLSVVPRLVAVFAALLIVSGWMGGQLLRYTSGLWQLLGEIQL